MASRGLLEYLPNCNAVFSLSYDSPRRTAGPIECLHMSLGATNSLVAVLGAHSTSSYLLGPELVQRLI
eukprot:1139847-Pelagomonas_calceolata.AAC.14